MRTRVFGAIFAGAALAAFGMPLSAFAQSLALAAQAQAPAPTPAQQAPQVRRLTADEAVQLALENNLGIRLARIDPQIEDLNVLSARTGWTPLFTTVYQQSSSSNPPNSLLSGATTNVVSGQILGNASIQQTLKHGGNYSIGWDATRSTTNSFFQSFNPQLRTNLALSFTQPLLRGWDIDNVRQQLQTAMKNREISDVDVRETLARTTRTVRRAYMELAYAVANLAVQRQSLDLARQSLRDTRARIEIGTTPPIDEIADQAEVFAREEAVIVGEAAIQQNEDTLRALVFDPRQPDFWTMRIEATEMPPLTTTAVDVDRAVRNAITNRTDLARARKQVELNDVAVRFLRNQTLPEVTASVDYGLLAQGGTQVERAPGPNPFQPGEIIGTTTRRFFPVLGDLFSGAPRWTAALNISYPLGTSTQEANLARTRLQNTQLQTQIQQQELNITTQVRQTARQVTTNQQRVQTSRASREFAERRLDAEQRKLAAGTSTNFLVFQAQRDLAVARNNELRAILDYNQSVVDLETVQEVPLQ
jgi:HAE1 family hydrophobic/amphiphilic exporter-1